LTAFPLVHFWEIQKADTKPWEAHKSNFQELLQGRKQNPMGFCGRVVVCCVFF